MNYYLLIGLGVYLGISASRFSNVKNGIKNKEVVGFLLGFVLACVLWPIGLVVAVKSELKKEKAKED